MCQVIQLCINMKTEKGFYNYLQLMALFLLDFSFYSRMTNKLRSNKWQDALKILEASSSESKRPHSNQKHPEHVLMFLQQQPYSNGDIFKVKDDNF